MAVALRVMPKALEVCQVEDPAYLTSLCCGLDRALNPNPTGAGSVQRMRGLCFAGISWTD
jgi:hypothetical protein